MGKLPALVLDAGPLLTQTYNDLQTLADKFYTTPSVHAEIKDARARQNLLLWGDNLVLRQPKPEAVTAVTEFAKKTGDYAVLSSTDLQVIALAYEVDVEAHGGDTGHLRKAPKPVVTGGGVRTRYGRDQAGADTDADAAAEGVENINLEDKDAEDDGFTVVTKPKRKGKRGGRGPSKSQPKAESELEVQPEPKVESGPNEESGSKVELGSNNEESGSKGESGPEGESGNEIIDNDWDSDDDDGWITSDNVKSLLANDGGAAEEREPEQEMKAALSTGDFAAQNVTLQMGLGLVNPTNGRQIRSVKNYMLRCHACFKLTALPRDGRPQHFCPRCGGDTLLRVTVAVSSDGTLEVFLKRNMQWSHRGFKYSLPNPQSKAARRGKVGAERHEDTGAVLLREDQREYEKAVKTSMWRQRQHDKMLDEWVGGGSADGVMNPFAIGGYNRDAVRHSGVRVGRGRYVNTARKR